MTTIIGMCLDKGLLIASDSQVSMGNLKIPGAYPKIEIIDDRILCAGSGSVGGLQQMLKAALQNIRINKIVLDNQESKVDLKELVDTLAEMNWQYPLEYKKFDAFSFLLGGLELGEPKIYSVGSDGSVINLESYFADGSGCEAAMGVLSIQFESNLSLKSATTIAAKAIMASSELDVFTDDNLQIYTLEKNKKEWVVQEYDFAKK